MIERNDGRADGATSRRLDRFARVQPEGSGHERCRHISDEADDEEQDRAADDVSRKFSQARAHRPAMVPEAFPRRQMSLTRRVVSRHFTKSAKTMIARQTIMRSHVSMGYLKLPLPSSSCSVISRGLGPGKATQHVSRTP